MATKKTLTPHFATHPHAVSRATDVLNTPAFTMTTPTDERIISVIRDSIRQGAEFTPGQAITGEYPEAGEFYEGAKPGMIRFEHIVTASDLEATK